MYMTTSRSPGNCLWMMCVLNISLLASRKIDSFLSSKFQEGVESDGYVAVFHPSRIKPSICMGSGGLVVDCDNLSHKCRQQKYEH